METETMSKLVLEMLQFLPDLKTKRELELEAEVERLRGLLRTCDGSHVASEEWRMAVAAALEPAEAGEEDQ